MNVDFCLTEFNEKIISWKCHIDNYTSNRYDMILGRYLLTTLGLDLKFDENIVINVAVPYEGCLSPMVDISNCEFKPLTYKIVKLEEYFINMYVNKCLESKITMSSMRRMCGILDAKYEKDYLHKVMTKQCKQSSTK